MWFFALATDYDGTIATHGGVDEPTLAALERLRKTGRKLILVTGRQLDELLTVFPRVDLFDWVVAENGALLYRPSDKLEKSLAKGPPPEFVSRLQSRGVERIACGHAIVATWEPWENVVLDTIREQGLELQVIFNKGAVMVLPSGVNKSTGLAAALQEMRLSAHNVAAVGDAENDHALLHSCEVGVAVANALPALKDAADWVASQGHGAGVAELIDNIIDNDLRMLDGQLQRHDLLLGHRETDVTQGNGHASPNGQTSHQVAAEPRAPITGVVPITDEPSRTEVRLSPHS